MEAESNPLRGLDILLVEDEYIIALDAEEILKELDVGRTSVVGTFDDAQRVLESQSFDLVILDVNLNGKKSFPLAIALEQRGTPFVFASGYTLSQRADMGLANAIWVSKPYDKEGLKAALNQALLKKSAAHPA